MGSLVCIVNRSRSLLRRGPTNSTLKIYAHLFFAAHLSNTQKERGNILLQTDKLYRRDLAYSSFSFNPRTTHKRQTDRMKLALSTLVVVVLAAILDTSSSSPIVGPFRDLQLPQLRIPSLDNVISAPGRAIDSGMRRMRQQTENFQRAMGRAGDRFQRGLVNLRPENFMNAIDNMIPDLIPGVPVIG